MTSSNLNPLRSTQGPSGSPPPTQGSEGNNSSSGSSSVGKEFAELQQKRQELRANEAGIQFNKDASETAENIAGVKSKDIEDAHNAALVQETNHINNAQESKTNAQRLNSEAVNLKAAARGRDARVARQLKLQAKEKELKALLEEYNARKEENNAYDAKRKAAALGNKAHDMRRAEEANKRAANNARVDLKDIDVQSNNVESQIKDAKNSKNPTSINPQETGESPIGKNKPPVGIDGGQPVQNTATGYGLGDGEIIRISGNPLLDAARALLRAVMRNIKAPRNINPTNMLSMHATNKTLYDLAISYLDAAQTQSAIQGTPVNQDIIFTRTQATTGKGETETAIQYWTNMQQQNVQAEKDTFKQAERA